MPVFFILGKPNTKPHTPRSACFPRMANAPVTLFATQCETAPRNCTRNRGAARRSDSGPGVVSSLERQSSDTAARARLLAFSSGAAAPRGPEAPSLPLALRAAVVACRTRTLSPVAHEQRVAMAAEKEAMEGGREYTTEPKRRPRFARPTAAPVTPSSKRASESSHSRTLAHTHTHNRTS